MANKYSDPTSAVQVIGCVFNNPALLDEGDKYVVNDEDFDNDFHKIVFGSIYNLYESGVAAITVPAVCDYLANKPKSNEIFQSNKGDEWLTSVSHSANLDTFDYYYNRLKKISILRAYNKIGVDVDFIYNPDTLDAKLLESQEVKLDAMSLNEIADAIDSKIEAVRFSYTTGDFEEESHIGDGLRELVESFAKFPEVGVPLYGKYINRIHRGARLKKLYLRSAPSGYGKALPNYQKIPTPNGWKIVGDIKPGDYLFGSDGKPTKVLQIHPQLEPKQIYEVHLKDGRVVECCKDHLWSYYSKGHRGGAVLNTSSTEEILKKASQLQNGFRNGGKSAKGFRFALPMNAAVEYPEAELPIDPYAMGLILGDGSLRYDMSQKGFAFSSADEELVASLAELIGASSYKRNSQYNYNWMFKSSDGKTDRNGYLHNIWVEELLKDFPELWQAKSENKFIPKVYLTASKEQRLALLQGLMDTDGSIERVKGRVCFTTISPQLRDDIMELCRSLGFITTCHTDRREGKYPITGECYDIAIQCHKSIKPSLFRLQRKVAIAEKFANDGKRGESKDKVSIIDIVPTDRYTEMTCFTVEAEDHLFLTGDYVITHNTRLMVADACYVACSRYFNPEKQLWEELGAQQSATFIATEQDLSEIQTIALAFVSGVDEEHILNYNLTEEEKERLTQGYEILEKSGLKIQPISDFSVDDIEGIIKRDIRERNSNYFFFDYIKSSLKILAQVSSATRGMNLRQDNVLFILASKLKDLCNKYGVFIETSTQLSNNWRENETPDQTLLRDAKSISDVCDYCSHWLPVNARDKEMLAKAVPAGNYPMPQYKLSIYKNRRGRYKGIYLWAIADLGCVDVRYLYATTWDYSIIDELTDLKINVAPKQVEVAKPADILPPPVKVVETFIPAPPEEEEDKLAEIAERGINFDDYDF